MVCRPHRGIVMGLANPGYSAMGSGMGSGIDSGNKFYRAQQRAMGTLESLNRAYQASINSSTSVDRMLYSRASGERSAGRYSTQSYFLRQDQPGAESYALGKTPMIMSSPMMPSSPPSLEEGISEVIVMDAKPKRAVMMAGGELEARLYTPMELDVVVQPERRTIGFRERQESLAKRLLAELKGAESADAESASLLVSQHGHSHQHDGHGHSHDGHTHQYDGLLI